MTQKQNGVLEWLQSCETPAPSEPKIEAVIVAGKSYMNSSEFNKNSMRDIKLNKLQFLPNSIKGRCERGGGAGGGGGRVLSGLFK